MTVCLIVTAYVVSIVIGALLTFCWSFLLYRQLDKQLGKADDSTRRIMYLPVLTGIVERAIVTTMVIWTPRLVVTFVGGWMAFKIAGGWGLLKESTPRNRATYIIGLLGSVISIGWAIGVGLYFAPESLANLANASSN